MKSGDAPLIGAVVNVSPCDSGCIGKPGTARCIPLQQMNRSCRPPVGGLRQLASARLNRLIGYRRHT